MFNMSEGSQGQPKVATVRAYLVPASPTEALLPGEARNTNEAPGGCQSPEASGRCQRTSARTTCSSGASLATLHSPASGSSSKDAATARSGCGLRPRHQHDHQAAAAGAHQLGIGLVAPASGGDINSHICAGLGLTASPARVTVLTMVASTACCAPCYKAYKDSPFATISMRRSPETGTSMFTSATRTLRATRAPASWHTLAPARSRGRARHASTPDVAHAALWSPRESRRPRQAHVRGATGSGKRSRRSSKLLVNFFFFFSHTSFNVRPLRGPSVHAQSPRNTLRHATGKAGCWAESPTTSLRNSMSTSTLASAAARSHLSVTCPRMLVTPSQCPRADYRFRTSPPLSPPREPRLACRRCACAVAVGCR